MAIINKRLNSPTSTKLSKGILHINSESIVNDIISIMNRLDRDYCRMGHYAVLDRRAVW
jgi:hypothetical protein